ncbi:MAG: hypothetical protein ACJATA_001920 [Sphingobacteriales bacterium]|jgi:hypothetical protein
MKYLLIITALLFTGCQDFFFQEVDDKNAPKITPMLNMVSYAEDEGKMVLILGKVIPSNEATDPWSSDSADYIKYQVNNATVTVTQRTKTFSLSKIEDKESLSDIEWLFPTYFYGNTDVRAYTVYGDTSKKWKAGESYTIEAKADNLTAKGTMNVLQKNSFAEIGEVNEIEEIATDQFDFSKENGPWFEFNIKGIPKDLTNLNLKYEFINYFANGDVTYSYVFFFIPQTNQLTYELDFTLNTPIFSSYSLVGTIPINEYYQDVAIFERNRGTTLDSSVCIIDLAHYTTEYPDFINSLESNGFNNPFVEPSQVLTNLEQGMGFLYSSNKTELRIRFK